MTPEIVEDFLVEGDDAEFIGFFIRIPRARKWLVILDQKAHHWLHNFDGVYIGFSSCMDYAKKERKRGHNDRRKHVDNRANEFSRKH